MPLPFDEVRPLLAGQCADSFRRAVPEAGDDEFTGAKSTPELARLLIVFVMSCDDGQASEAIERMSECLAEYWARDPARRF